MKKRFILLLFLAVLLLSGCEKAADAVGFAPTLSVAEDELTLTLRVETETLKSHAGQRAKLIELLPDEELSSVGSKTPVAEEKLTAKLKFRFPLSDPAGNSRQYRSYVILLSDGTLLTETPVLLSNPEALAPTGDKLPNADLTKGLSFPATDAAAEGKEFDLSSMALSLYAGHALCEISLPALLNNGTDVLIPARPDLLCNGPLLAYLDGRIGSATDAGLQVILQVLPDPSRSLQDHTDLLDALLARYSGGEHGRVTSLILDLDTPRTSQNQDTLSADADRAAALLRIGRTALLSRYASGRVYLAAEGTVAEVTQYYTAVHAAVDAGGRFFFGAAIKPDPVLATQSAELHKTDGEIPYLCLSDLPALSQDLSETAGRYNGFAVIGVEISAAEADVQAALVTLAYRAAMNAKADFMIYQSPIGAAGLYDPDLTARPAAQAFRLCDTDANLAGETLAASFFPDAWSALEAPRYARIHVRDVANLGTSGDAGRLLFDFSDAKKAPAFTLVGRGAQPMLHNSASFDAQVLAASPALESLSDTEGSGYRCTLSNPSALKNSYVLSALLLPQSGASHARVTLKLQGSAADGRALSYTSSILLTPNTWQTVSFHVRTFTSQMDPSAPVSLTLLLLPDQSDLPDFGDASAPNALWLHSLNTRAAAPDFTLPLILGTLTLGFALSLLLVLVLRKKRKRRK